MQTSSEARLVRIIQESRVREKEALKCYRPMNAAQLRVHESQAKELIARGGKRCISGDSRVFDPVLRDYRRVDQIQGEWHVYARDEQGKRVIARAGQPFIKGRDKFFRVHLTNGVSFKCTWEHRVLRMMRDEPKWCSINEVLETASNNEAVGLWAFDKLREVKPGDASADVLGEDDVWDFTVAEHHNYEMAGVIHHNSGKSTSIVCEFAARILGEPIIRADGTKVPLKYKAPTKDDKQIFWVIGYDVNHIGQTLHRLIFEPGLFRVTQENGKWRTWHKEHDAHLPNEPCGPVIPPRLIEAIDWESRSALHFREVRLVNGAVIRAYPSTARTPKQGDPVSGIWIDEDIQSPEHLKEYQDRLTDRDGWFLWSAWPHVENDALMGLLDRAEDTATEEQPLIEAVKLVMSDNTYITDASKEHAFARMGDEDEVLRRNEGELLLGSIAMYDFAKGLHTISQPKGPTKYDLTEWRDYLTKLYVDYGGFPHTWTRYLAIDPSHTRTGVCFGVVPPPEVDGIHLGNMVIVEREVVLKKANATVLAEACAKYMRHLRYEAFVMDKAMGRKTNVGTDLTIFEVYAKAFKAAGLSSAQTNNWFVPGIDITEQRYRAVRNVLEVNQDGKVGLLVVSERCPQTINEFKTYRKKVTRAADGLPLILDVPANPKAHDCMAALEYLIAFLELEFARGAGYVAAREQVSTGGSAAYRASQRNLFGRKHEESLEYVHLGAGERAEG